ncbi:hypothetical protein [Actinomadura nitritigenes]|uniref:hypothetical protein n=1 Tax=Actinomadura nitritigenes TaxID=134602 RepID=UPI003D8AA86F
MGVGDLITALTAARRPAETALLAVDTVLAYVNGFTIEERTASVPARCTSAARTCSW